MVRETYGMARRGPHERAGLEVAMQRVYALSRGDQLRLFAALRGYLGVQVGPGGRAQPPAQALDALRQVADDLGRPGEQMTVDEFKCRRSRAPVWSGGRPAGSFAPGRAGVGR